MKRIEEIGTLGYSVSSIRFYPKYREVHELFSVILLSAVELSIQRSLIEKYFVDNVPMEIPGVKILKEKNIPWIWQIPRDVVSLQ